MSAIVFVTKNATAPIMNIRLNVMIHASASDGTSSASWSGSVVSALTPDDTSSAIAIGSTTTEQNGTAARWLDANAMYGWSGRSKHIDIAPSRISSLICHATHEPMRFRTIRFDR